MDFRNDFRESRHPRTLEEAFGPYSGRELEDLERDARDLLRGVAFVALVLLILAVTGIMLLLPW